MEGNIYNLLAVNYQLIKALHIISVIAWMAAMLYLPRLFVYHVSAIPGGEADRMLKIMEYKLQRVIMTPAMVATVCFGIVMIYIVSFKGYGLWLHAKLASVLILLIIHGMLCRYRKAFAFNKNVHSALFYRILNEAPTLCMIFIVLLAVIKPALMI